MTVFKVFANTLRAPPTDCFWKLIYRFKQQMHVSECVCKICQKESAIFLKCWESFEKLQSVTLIKMLFNKCFPIMF